MIFHREKGDKRLKLKFSSDVGYFESVINNQEKSLVNKTLVGVNQRLHNENLKYFGIFESFFY